MSERQRALEGAALAAAAAAAAWLAVSPRAVPARAWLRLGPSEFQMRRAFRVPLAYPERVCGGDRAATRNHFPAWAGELAADGLLSSDIIEAVRREEGQ